MCAVFEKVSNMEPKMTPTHQRLGLGRASGPTSPRASGSSLWSDCGMALYDHAPKKTQEKKAAGALTQHRTFVYNNHTYIYIYDYVFKPLREGQTSGPKINIGDMGGRGLGRRSPN